MKRHKFNGLIILVMLMASVAACVPQPAASPPDSTPVNSSPTPLSPTTTPEPTSNGPEFGVSLSELDELQIQFLHPWTGEMQDELVKMVDEFNQSNAWGIHVIMSAPGSAAMVGSKTWEGIANKQPPNVIAASPGFMLTVDEKSGLVQDLNPYVSSPAYGFSAQETTDLFGQYWNEDTTRGKRFGLPAQRSALYLIYNVTWAKELGFSTVPSTQDEFRTQVNAANALFRKNNDPVDDGLGGWLINTETATMLSWLLSFGVEPLNDGDFQFSGKAGEEAFKFLLDLKADSSAWVGKPSKDVEYFTNRQALVITAWLQDLGEIDAAIKRSNSTDEWSVIPFPGASQQTLVTAGISYAILHHTPAEDLAAWLFIRWLTGPEQQTRLLRTNPTLPLSAKALELAGYFEGLPQWTTAVNMRDYFVPQPLSADWQVVGTVLEDAGWQLLKTELTEDQIAPLLAELDDLSAELAEQHP